MHFAWFCLLCGFEFGFAGLVLWFGVLLVII